MCCSVSASFLTFSIIAIVAMFTLTLLNMIFSIITPKKFETFYDPASSASAYKNVIASSMLDELKNVKSYEKSTENIRVLKEKFETVLIEKYSKQKLEEWNIKVQKNKGVLMAFGITSFCVIVGFSMIFIPIYSSYDCGTNCSQSCDCNCDCSLCLGVTPIKRIILFYLICSPTILFAFICFFITLAKKVTYSSISSMKDIKNYENFRYNFWGDKKLYYFEDSVDYNNAQFIIYLIILIVLVVYPLTVWFTTTYEEMHPPIIPYQKKVRYVPQNNTELSAGIQVTTTERKVNDTSYNSHPIQPQYQPPPPQPIIRPPPPQPHYQPPPPHYQPPPPHYHPPPPPHHHPPPPPHHHPPPPPPHPHHVSIFPHLGITLPRIRPPQISISIH